MSPRPDHTPGILTGLPDLLPLDFYSQGAEVVAPKLLGKLLVRHDERGGVRAGRITETEAYVGEHDLACHARFGRTARTAALYGPPGHSYVYLIYGMYQMLNVVAAPENDPQAVLIRGIEPLAGIEGKTDGPGKLTRALGIDGGFNRLPFTRPPLTLHDGEEVERMAVTPRIGIDYAGEWKDAPLRFVEAS